MTIRSFAAAAMLLAFASPRALPSIGSPTSSAPIAIYYSFDRMPSESVVNQLQQEAGRILTPSGSAMEWHEIGTDSGGDYADILVLRFHGSCSMIGDGRKEAPLGPNERSLAETQVSNGQVLPFADVQCDLLRRFLEAGPEAENWGEVAMSRAMARVAAHEIFHMLTRSVKHCRTGIGQAEFSRKDLTAASFQFAPEESAWLRGRYSRLQAARAAL